MVIKGLKRHCPVRGHNDFKRGVFASGEKIPCPLQHFVTLDLNERNGVPVDQDSPVDNGYGTAVHPVIFLLQTLDGWMGEVIRDCWGGAVVRPAWVEGLKACNAVSRIQRFCFLSILRRFSNVAVNIKKR